MIHPHTELQFINTEIGYGVVATRFIPKGTITWAIDKLDRIFTPQQIKSLDPLYQKILDTYSYRNAEGNHVLCWDNARFVNHSSNSNCITTAYEFEVAIRDIHPGEQLTDDYGYLNLEEPFDVVPEAGTDRNTIYPDDLLRHYHIWDEKLLSAFALLMDVDQPLWNILTEATKEKATHVAEGDTKMDSILNCYCPKHEKINGEAKLVKIHSPKVAYPF
ncbi:MAG TPA: SET domain-containing protein [Chryseolinea sp.]|nr:SET domain-containing protein [Chryseolinea sp.]HPM30903.1 SET domain-containing protein [Chryseolinea sp.]